MSNKVIDKEYVLECFMPETDDLFSGWVYMWKHPSLEQVIKVKNYCIYGQINSPHTEDKMRIRVLITTQEYQDLDELIDVPNVDYEKKLTVQ